MVGSLCDSHNKPILQSSTSTTDTSSVLEMEVLASKVATLHMNWLAYQNVMFIWASSDNSTFFIEICKMSHFLSECKIPPFFFKNCKVLCLLSKWKISFLHQQQNLSEINKINCVIYYYFCQLLCYIP